jgi:transcriptional regulator with XRE-family HTH domain
MNEFKNELNTRFGRAVRELRETQGWSQEQLAENADLNRSYLGEVERGVKTPSLATVEKLAFALQVSLSTLVARCERAPQV